MPSLMQITRRTAALLLISTLAACGGGGDGGSGGSNGGGGGSEGGGGNTGGGNGGGTGNQAVTGTYKLGGQTAASHAQMLNAANSMGADGYALFSSLAGSISPTSTEIGDFYLTDTAHAGRKFSYVNPAAQPTRIAFLAQLNQQGSSGYMYKSDAVFSDVSDIRSVYVKDNSRSDQFSYRTVTPVAKTAEDFAAELNGQGAAGYRYLGPQIINNELFSLYAKRNDSVTYTYQVDKLGSSFSAADAAAMRTRLAPKGADGWFIRGTQGLGSDPMNMNYVDVFEKSSAQNGAIEYLVEASASSDSLTTQLNNMNANAAKGFFYFSGIMTADGKTSTIYVKNSAWMINPLAGVTFP
ncbi:MULTISPECIES: hypothetical protein [Comamonas]|uniref:Lipoprotein n=2 Tax=Comamonas testosteroni TaxID=285 RepID=A0A8B4RYE5_COMTE|nr:MULTISPECIES: hypothetical protein [Comamonas]QQN70561.1 hypothetical protein IYN88_03805 [Comamonas testosteroni]RDI13518.1 hypothetical protein DFO48_10218 [Comamonas sp. AG1104]SUY74755.1 Uncharacterised protein [Comamonas testosteroni]